MFVLFQVVKLTSPRNPLPFEFYHLPFCRPQRIQRRAENLGMQPFQDPIKQVTSSCECVC